jgi:hypothetical protein
VTAATMRFMAPPTPLHRVKREVILRGSLRSAFLRRHVDSGRLAEPAVYGEGNGVAGRPLPADVPVRLVVHGFAVARLHGDDVLVRPDGYVAGPLDGDAETAVADLLRARSGPST